MRLPNTLRVLAVIPEEIDYLKTIQDRLKDQEGRMSTAYKQVVEADHDEIEEAITQDALRHFYRPFDFALELKKIVVAFILNSSVPTKVKCLITASVGDHHQLNNYIPSLSKRN